MIIRQTKENEREAVLAFYNECGYSGGAGADDIIICAEEHQSFIAIVRLCTEEQVLVLKGMQVDKNYQRQGIGSALLHYLEPFIAERPCYCLPYGHLQSFYGQIGFEAIEEAVAPIHLCQRLERYRRKHEDMLMMKRPGNTLI